MKKQELEEAEKDILAIKESIDRTTDTLVSLGKIFIGWGIAFSVVCISIISLYIFSIPASSVVRDYPAMVVIPLIIAALFAFASYRVISRKTGFKGLIKPVLTIWLVIIAYATGIPVLAYLTQDLKHLIALNGANLDSLLYFMPYSSVVTLLFAFSFGLLCIKLFTNLKFAGLLSLVYSIIALLWITVTHVVSGEFYFIVSIISYCAILPLTFLILGGYLEFYRIRGN